MSILEEFKKLHEKVKDLLSPTDKTYYEERLKEWGEKGGPLEVQRDTCTCEGVCTCNK